MKKLHHDGVAGEMITSSGPILRILHLSCTQLSIYDCVTPPAQIEGLSSTLPVSLGYDRNEPANFLASREFQKE